MDLQVFMLVLMVYSVFMGFICVVIAEDAGSRDMNGIAWAWLVFLFPLPALVIYLFVVAMKPKKAI